MDIVMFEQMLLTVVTKVKTEPELRDKALQLRGTEMFSNITDEEFEKAFENAADTLNVFIGKSYSIEEFGHKKWFRKFYKDLSHTRWERYKDYLQVIKGFGNDVITNMENNLFEITDLLGDPNGKNFSRKGLIVGDVQSGKTANYVGLMNLATDVGYNIMIVLTGTTNTLREQTQIRIEEGIGISNLSDGVKKIQNADYKQFKGKDPIFLTSRNDDFSKSRAGTYGASLGSNAVPIVIVTKKNVNALKNIFGWLEKYSKGKNDNMIDSSLLLIDDEADFASVNTGGDESPTAINRSIRNILALFTKSSYIGFTATPYANVFINPETEETMENQDIFPKDYIYVLGESEKYIGIQSVFSDDKDVATNDFMVIPINDSEVETYLPLKHKKMDTFTTMPPSMKEAINLFLIANTIRDMRNHIKTHRSMLINASRFIHMHEQIKSVVSEYLSTMQKVIRLNGRLSVSEALKIPEIALLKENFEKEYASLEDGFTFAEILPNMNDSIYDIHAEIVNAEKENKGVNYQATEEKGEYERVIIIGGFALSRGLTLEGLMISYYWRNSIMYDSLLQMGRWFGYRPKYRDLCRIFMSRDVISDYQFIATATEELKNDLARNSNRGLTPKQFGIRVRTGQAGLIITARNKMKTGESITARASFSKDIIETTSFSVTDQTTNDKNTSLIQALVDDNSEQLVTDESGKRKVYGLKDISKNKIIDFLNGFVSIPGSRFDGGLIVDWLNENDDSKLENWDVFFLNGEANTRYDYGHDVSGDASERLVFVPTKPAVEGAVKNNRSRLGSPGDGRYGLNQEQKEIEKEIKAEFYQKKNFPQKEYFRAEFNRKPVILIYSVIPKFNSEDVIDKSLIEAVNNTNPIPLLSVEIPELDEKTTKYVNYTVNKIYQNDDVEVERDEE